MKDPVLITANQNQSASGSHFHQKMVFANFLKIVFYWIWKNVKTVKVDLETVCKLNQNVESKENVKGLLLSMKE